MVRLSPGRYADGLQRRARAMYASDERTFAEGVIVSYTDAPTYTIVTDDGRTVPWRCDLTDVGAPVSDENYFRHANARRIRDGRNSIRPEFRDDLPKIHTGMSLADVVNRVVAAGHDLDKVLIEYAGCGSHEVTLSEDLRSRAEIEAEIELETAQQEAAERARAAADRAAAEAEAIDADPTRGW